MNFELRICFGFRISDFGFPRPRRGFSALEFFVALGILAILLAIFIPYLLKVREDNNRLCCFDNLRTLGTALAEYARDNGGDYPRVVYDPATLAGGYTCYTGADSPNPFAKDSSVAANDVTASLWLLVRMKLAQPADFICPSGDDAADTFTDAAGEPSAIEYRSNFRDPQNLSYSYACPFSAAAGYRFNSDRLGSDFAVLADKNPGVGDGSKVTGPPAGAPPLALAAANSTNHGRAGQNVLYADGHAEFRTTPYCGVDGDNIYTAQASAPLAASGTRPPANVNGVLGQTIGPAQPTDSYLVPTESDISSESGSSPAAPPPHPPAAAPSKPHPRKPAGARTRPTPPTASPPPLAPTQKPAAPLAPSAPAPKPAATPTTRPHPRAPTPPAAMPRLAPTTRPIAAAAPPSPPAKAATRLAPTSQPSRR